MTERQGLRPFQTTDPDDVFAYRRLLEVIRFLHGEAGIRDETPESLAIRCLLLGGDSPMPTSTSHISACDRKWSGSRWMAVTSHSSRPLSAVGRVRCRSAAVRVR